MTVMQSDIMMQNIVIRGESMTKKEFAIFAAALKTYYPREALLPNDQAMELWFRQLEDIPYKVAEAGLNKWVATQKWSPSIADIREMSAGIQNGDIPDWGEGWKDVQKAIQRYGWYHQKEAMECFDGITKQTVERLGFANLCLSENPETDRMNFRVIYQQLAERKKQEAQIPQALKEVIASITGSDSERKLIE